MTTRRHGLIHARIPDIEWETPHRELEAVRDRYNRVRLHAGVGYVTPEDEHAGRGPQIRHARLLGLARARQARLAYHRTHKNNHQS